MHKLIAIMTAIAMLASSSMTIYAETTADGPQSETQTDVQTTTDDTIVRSGNYKYRILDDNTVELIEIFNATNHTIDFPINIDGKRISAIGPAILKDNQTVSYVSLPNSVKIIGDNAFYGCTNLKTVIFPSSIETIGEFAFVGTGIKSVLLSNSLKNINRAAFMNCVYLEKISIPNSVTTIGEAAFLGCKALKEVKFPKSLEIMGGHAFAGSGVENVDLVGSFTTIPEYAFTQCENLKTLKMSDSITTIEDGAFSLDQYLEEITFSKNLEVIGDRAFEKTHITSLDLPSKVKSIGMLAFGCCNHLEKVRIPNSVKEMGQAVFQMCLNLSDVTTGSLIEIPAWTFYSNNLKNITIPPTVKTIGEHAFSCNNHLKSVTILGNNVTIDKLAFSDNGQLEKVAITGKNITLEGGVFCNDILLSDLTIPAASLKNVPDYMFSNCFSLINIDLSNAETIGKEALTRDENLAKVFMEDKDWTNIIPNPLAERTIIFSDKLKSIENRAFLECDTKNTTLYVVKDTYGEEWAKTNNMPYIARESGDTPQKPEPSIVLGDVNGDGCITSDDALSVLRASVHLEHFDENTKKIADVDFDEQITSSDALKILRTSVGLN